MMIGEDYKNVFFAIESRNYGRFAYESVRLRLKLCTSASNQMALR